MASINLVLKKGTKNANFPYQVKIYTVWESVDLKFIKKSMETDDINQTVILKYYFDTGPSYTDGYVDFVHLSFNVMDASKIPTNPSDHSTIIYSCVKNGANWIETDEGTIRTKDIPEGE